ncbi:hypothetical protein AGABI1DRAFT_116751 [Agaricus bisporus var. burnettii JB137-S8]|uniref:Uncharacterized protein n=1 Tax=Agaricus bisporus var. burnettii (strain JB137-S8 / ATCC MYA-4627 / FGSC 10392) TaxID=597362 RepID=K5WW51_AGABU|nr:uncharacterized protein AGABI1DRAFT_116751 [Agaricus bisporus var. burnettii JB137-S8]EKM74792.1 hypothetical protein AGABI1DRAFT_116751 [Agaricus bisporus var. burnettii JB137-S8]
MRTVYSIPQHRQYLRGGYPSEPFLAEAAARATLAYFNSTLSLQDRGDIPSIITKYKDVVPGAVSAWFDQGLIDKGNRGELVARMLCTLAHDISILNKVTPAEKFRDVSFSQMVPVLDFLHTLIAEEHVDKIYQAQPANTTGKPLKEVFANTYVHFTQFVKAGDNSVMTDEAAYLFFTRGAAIQGYGTMCGVDLIIPVWIRGDGNPDRWSMTAIFIQVKNRKTKETIQIDVQKDYKFFTGDHKRPYITIAMQLGLTDKTTNELPVVEVSPPRSEGRKVNQKMKLHPRYEIFINGCSNEAYGVISGARNTYSSLLTDKDILSEHPRAGGFLAAVKRMKPFWRIKSYGWATMKKKGRLENQFIETGQSEEEKDSLVESDGEQEGDNDQLSTDLNRLRISSGDQ